MGQPIELTSASARAFSASLDWRRMDSVMSGRFPGVCARAAVWPRYLGVVVPPYRFGLCSREEAVLRGIPEDRRRPPTYNISFSHNLPLPTMLLVSYVLCADTVVYVM